MSRFLNAKKIESMEDRSAKDHQIFSEKWGLTPRECDVLNCLEQGYSNRKIAQALCISENTVKFHLKNIYIRMNVESRLEAAMLCNET